ncbi:MAG: hypothetical protein AAF298_04190 [Cyanobacteria bacterium P01_A01_bin.40]
MIELISAQKIPKLKACSIWFYENTPCSYCRHQIVQILVERQQASQAIFQECMSDCSSEIRTLVKAGKYY